VEPLLLSSPPVLSPAERGRKSGNLPIPFWFTEFGIILHHANGMLILCHYVQCMCTCRFVSFANKMFLVYVQGC